jgi:hypothetical protein
VANAANDTADDEQLLVIKQRHIASVRCSVAYELYRALLLRVAAVEEKYLSAVVAPRRNDGANVNRSQRITRRAR